MPVLKEGLDFQFISKRVGENIRGQGLRFACTAFLHLCRLRRLLHCGILGSRGQV